MVREDLGTSPLYNIIIQFFIIKSYIGTTVRANKHL